MKILSLLILIIIPNLLFAQQIADTTYHPIIKNPEYDPGKGPIVFIDEGHHNFHTLNGRYQGFSKLLESDGYIVKEYVGLFNQEELSKGKILVISNALNVVNVTEWVLPNPSAFTTKEIAILKNWVHQGGSLFLIADHMPMAGASQNLALEFGFEFTNGYAINTVSRSGTGFFNLKENTLSESIVTKGRDDSETVSKVVSFTGQAFKLPDDAIPILTLDKDFVLLLPDTAGVFNNQTPRINVGGWSQGAYKTFGKGKIAVFGEAAMFTTQISRGRKIGMNNENASQNHQLLLNIIHWLDGKLDN